MSLNLAGIVPVGTEDLNSNSTTQKAKPGAYAFMLDAFGPRLFRYGFNVNGSAVISGELMTRDGSALAATSAGTITAGSTTSATTSGLTADQHVGKIFYVTDDAGGAGAAPEGESSIVSANSATLITLDADMPLSAAIAASDTASLISVYTFSDAAADDEAWAVFGVVVGTTGVGDDSYGWVQSWGMCPNVIATTSAVTVSEPLVADTAAVATAATNDTHNLVVGYAPIGAAADLASPFKTLVFLTMDFGFTPAVTTAT